MDRNYGLGLTGLIHPVTKEFNHEAVIENRGGRPEDQVLGNTKEIGLHHVIGKLHGLTQPTHALQVQMERNWLNIAGKAFDTYDIMSFWYGWIIAM
jgi:hypothetical protein